MQLLQMVNRLKMNRESLIDDAFKSFKDLLIKRIEDLTSLKENLHLTKKEYYVKKDDKIILKLEYISHNKYRFSIIIDKELDEMFNYLLTAEEIEHELNIQKRKLFLEKDLNIENNITIENVILKIVEGEFLCILNLQDNNPDNITEIDQILSSEDLEA